MSLKKLNQVVESAGPAHYEIFIEGVEDSKLACSEGYGLSVKNVPLNVATETNSQLIGQLVCG